MDNRPIGIFDSGIGGLTVVKQIYKLLPQESIIYFGDTARVPYGTRSKETVIRFSQQITNFLLNNNVKAIVIACSTATAQALNELTQTIKLPIYGVIEPAAITAALNTKNNVIGVIGTTGTINSDAFTKVIKQNNNQAQVINQPCPLFVPIIEEGIYNTPILQETIKFYFNKLYTNNPDTLVLGCTHFPVIKKVIKKSFKYPITLIDPGIEMAKFLTIEFQDKKLATSCNQKPTHKYYVTDNVESFRSSAETFLGTKISNQITKVALE